MKLLVVDDSLSMRRKIQRCLASVENIQTFSAANGQVAMEIFQKELPDVVTMDLTMPGVGGVECIKMLMEINPNVSILVISALSDKVTALAAIKNGAQGFLKKPFTDQELSIALDEVLSEEEEQ